MAGKHRKPSRLKVTLSATGGTVAGAAVVGVAAAVAQTSLSGGQPMAAASTSAAAIAAPKATPPKVAAAAPKTQVQKPVAKVPPQTRAKAPVKPPAEPAPKAPAPKKVTASQAIALAKSQVGITEDGNGETKYQDWYMSTKRAQETVQRDGGSVQGYEAAAWCSMFISWLGDRLGFADQMGVDAWTITHAEWFKERGRWGTKPLPGAVVFYDWGGGKSIDGIDHVGLVVRDNGNGTIQAIEGNTSNAVRVRERSSNMIVGYGYPDYAK